jgi:hypothetical protein
MSVTSMQLPNLKHILHKHVDEWECQGNAQPCVGSLGHEAAGLACLVSNGYLLHEGLHAPLSLALHIKKLLFVHFTYESQRNSNATEKPTKDANTHETEFQIQSRSTS